MDMMGPPAPPPHIAGPEPGRPDEPKRDILKELAPLLIAQGLDLLSTESIISHGGFERNPTPGMQTSLGRVGWNALESALVGLFLKKAPKLAKAYKAGSTLSHYGLAVGNDSMTREFSEPGKFQMTGRR